MLKCMTTTPGSPLTCFSVLFQIVNFRATFSGLLRSSGRRAVQWLLWGIQSRIQEHRENTAKSLASHTWHSVQRDFRSKGLPRVKINEHLPGFPMAPSQPVRAAPLPTRSACTNSACPSPPPPLAAAAGSRENAPHPPRLWPPPRAHERTPLPPSSELFAHSCGSSLM